MRLSIHPTCLCYTPLLLPSKESSIPFQVGLRRGACSSHIPFPRLNNPCPARCLRDRAGQHMEVKHSFAWFYSLSNRPPNTMLESQRFAETCSNQPTRDYTHVAVDTVYCEQNHWRTPSLIAKHLVLRSARNGSGTLSPTALEPLPV